MSSLSEGGVPDGHTSNDEHYHNHNELDSDTTMQLQTSHPNGAHNTEGRSRSPVSQSGGSSREAGMDAPKPSGERNRSRTRPGRTPSGNIRVCKKCGEPLMGQFVRALGGTFHLECFKCRVCLSSFLVYLDCS